MNLINMAQRQDRNLILSDAVKLAKRKVDGTLYRGFDIKPAKSPQLLIKNIFNWYPFCQLNQVTGWLVQSLKTNTKNKFVEIQLQDENGLVVASEKTYIGSKPVPVKFPNGLNNLKNFYQYNLVVEVPESTKESVFFIVHEVLERSEILSLCKGKGVEIGPGNNPQVLPTKKVDVTYVEQYPPEEWNTLYNENGKYSVDPKFWSLYQIGEADSLPVPDESLDFIFSSHVFEHLANPLGYLEYWHSKLKSGGLILAVVPDVAGCKDYVYRPCSLTDLLKEYNDKIMEPNLEHYVRWGKYRAPGKDPKTFYEAKRSIHVHFYTNSNMAELLSYAVENLDFSWFNIRHTPNHKDFYLVLAKA